LRYALKSSFKPSKDRYKQKQTSYLPGVFMSFKPSKDRYKPLFDWGFPPKGRSFKPSKDRYKLIVMGIIGYLVYRHQFQTLKGSLQTYVWIGIAIFVMSFKPSKDRYKPLLYFAMTLSFSSFKPSKDRYKRLSLGLNHLDH